MTDPTGSRFHSLSMFFPAYNDGGTIASLVIQAVHVAARLTPDFEVIIVNDGSTDSTRDIADELCRTYRQVRVIHHPRNRGYGGALRTGFAAATKELRETMERLARLPPLPPPRPLPTGRHLRRRVWSSRALSAVRTW